MSEVQLNHAQWRELVAEQEKSGLSHKAFCKKRDVSYIKFGYYRSLFKTKLNSAIVNKVEKPKTLSPVIAPIKIQTTPKPPDHDNRLLKLSLQNGMHCAFPVDIDLKRLQQLLGVLLSC